MLKIFFITFFIFVALKAESINSLLDKYEQSSDDSLNTIDEKIGNVIVYSQKEIKLMQYNKLSDILRELPLVNLHKNSFGLHTLTLPGTKNDVSGYFRFFLNDHEISSAHTQSAFLTWGDLPLDFIDYIEVYYGEGSFSLGNETGYIFIKAYTKNPNKENSTQITLSSSNKLYNYQGVSNSDLLENGWAYLIYASNQNSNDSSDFEDLNNHSNRKYAFADFENNSNQINLGYTEVNKTNFLGLATDGDSDEGKIVSKDFFASYSSSFLDDKSLKTSISLDANKREYDEENKEGIYLIPAIDFTSVGTTMPKEFSENLDLKKLNAFVSKDYYLKNNNILMALNYKNKTYDVKDRESTNFLNQTDYTKDYYDFNQEDIYSLLLQDNIDINDNLLFFVNTKYDMYERNGEASDENKFTYKIGSIYTPFENIGIKLFYTDTYIPYTFYNYDFKSQFTDTIKSTDINFYSIETTYITQNSKTKLFYNKSFINNFIYFTSVGFMNIDKEVEQDNYMFDYSYFINNNDKIAFNYFYTTLSEIANNSTNGATIKYMGKYKKYEYFTSLIYRNAYEYLEASSGESYDMSLGSSYNINKNLKLSLKFENVLNDSTESIYVKNSKHYTLDDRQRSVLLTLNWLF